MDPLTQEVKDALRISTSAFDGEITTLIQAAKMDLDLSGINNINTTEDAMAKRAIIIYCKANFGLGNDDADRYQASYDMIKRQMGLAAEYKKILGESG